MEAQEEAWVVVEPEDVAVSNNENANRFKSKVSKVRFEDDGEE